MRIAMLGVGTVGGIVAASLASRGVELALLARPDHAKAMRADGLTIVEPDGRLWSTPPLFASEVISEVASRPVDLVIFCAKAFDTQGILDAWLAAGGTAAKAISLQNTVQNEPLLAEQFDEVAGAVVRIGGDVEAPAKIRARIPRRLLLGRYPTGDSEWLTELASIFRSAGIETEEKGDIMPEKWFKLVLNCDSALSAICNLGVNELASSTAVAIRRQVRAEAEAALAAEGIAVPALPPIVEGPPAVEPGGYSSTWYDLHQRRGKVETSLLNGAIVELATKHDLPAIANRTLTTMCTQMAANGQGPGAYSLEDVAAAIARG